MRMLRFDRSTAIVHLDRGALARAATTNGTLVIEGHVGRVHRPGDALLYRDERGNEVHEHRDLAEVKRIVEQLAGAPITLQHPPGFVRGTSSKYVVGKVDAAWLDGEHAAARLVIHDAEAIAAIQSGTRELSLGYGCDVKRDERGLLWQHGIVVDHLAIVDAARCGSTCSLNTDHAPSGVTMDPQLEAALKLVNVRTDGLSQRDIALAVIAACGHNLDSATSNGQSIKAREDAYVIARAYYASLSHERQHADAAAFATIKPSVQRTDCGCGGKPSPHVDGDLERDARARMQRSSRLAYAEGTERADEAEAIERIRERTVQPFVPSTLRRGDSAPTDELAARQAMLAASRAAHLEPSPNPLATDKE